LLDALREQESLKKVVAEEKPDLLDWLGLRKNPHSQETEETSAARQLKNLEDLIKPALKEVNQRSEVQGAVDRASGPLYWIMLVYALCYMPTVTLTNALSFRNLSDPDRYFGGIRVLGTIGWIVAGWAVSFAIKEVSPQPLFLAAGSSALLGLFCFALPHTPPTREAKTLGEALGTPALKMLEDPPFLIFFICSFLVMFPMSFYFSWGNLFLTDIQAPFPTALQTIGQISEIFFMLMIPVGLRWLGTKWMLVVGMFAWCLRYGIFATLNLPLIIAIGLPLHGICYDFFFVVSYLYVDRQAPKHLRASAQGFITVVTLGVGMFLGNLAGGAIKDYFTDGKVDYQHFWLVPLAMATGVMVLFAVLFREPKPRPETDAA
jgi:nucleoside transporter